MCSDVDIVLSMYFKGNKSVNRDHPVLPNKTGSSGKSINSRKEEI